MSTMNGWQKLEDAIVDTARLSDEVMTLEGQLKHHKAQAESFKAKLRDEKVKIQQEHRVEVKDMDQF